MKRPLDGDATLALLSEKDPEGLELIRHDAAHVLAQAVQELFPGTQVTIGPIDRGRLLLRLRPQGAVLDGGLREDRSEDDARSSTGISRSSARSGTATRRSRTSRRSASTTRPRSSPTFPRATRSRSIARAPWADLCRGPHLPSTGKLPKAFKLMKLAGAYWRGDHRNEMLQRIYGTAWANEADLAAHLKRIEEAEKRDHRKLGRELDLFHMQEEGKGMVFWHPKGWTLWRAVESLYAPPSGRGRLCRGADAAGARPRSSGSSRATGKSIATTCSSAKRPKTKCCR